MTIPIKIVKRIAEKCLYSGCGDKAIDGSDYCAPHDAHERGRAANRQRRHRKKLAEAGLCIAGCGRKVPRKRKQDGSIVARRCSKCRKANNDARAKMRSDARVTDDARGVTGEGADPHFKTETGSHDWGSGTYRTERYVGKGKRGRLTNEEQIAELRRDLLFAREKLDEAIRVLPVLATREVLELGTIQRAAAKQEVASPAAQASRMIDDVVERLTGA